jgi:hypothetical protein
MLEENQVIIFGHVAQRHAGCEPDFAPKPNL